MNDEKHLRELLQAALDGKDIQWNESPDEWTTCDSKVALKIRLSNIVLTSHMYRIKPEVKTFTYQTRVYMVNETIRVWSSADSMNEKELEKYYAPQQFKWLAPAQTHTIEYTE